MRYESILDRLLHAVERALAARARDLADHGVRRLVVAGGDTSGAVVEALGLTLLRIGPAVAPGVPWTEATRGAHFLNLLLKSGNFGAEDLFAAAQDLQ
ncbi:nucleotide-binding domain containing protein [Streptomyces sp. 049-1]|uniref:nucleotide-binding domain containing protein n=1 Tax=Streptomyces sp. 049-1 TaxID=2789264 RepID=UPI00397F2A12